MHKIKLTMVGKNKESYINEAVLEFTKRLSKFVDLEVNYIDESKVLREQDVVVAKREETKKSLARVTTDEVVIVLDNEGNVFTSEQFAVLINAPMQDGMTLHFLIGGAYGFDRELLSERSHVRLSLSQMISSHQIIRIFFLEQLYRAMTIIKGTRYHHG